MYDVIIVGGGPAGSSAALFLATGGAKCLLIDRARFPRNKPCGGGITARAVEKFPFLEGIMESGNYQGIMHYKKPEESISTIDKEGRPIGYFVRRTKFDNDLLD